LAIQSGNLHTVPNEYPTSSPIKTTTSSVSMPSSSVLDALTNEVIKPRRQFEAPWLILIALFAATCLTAYQNHRQAKDLSQQRFVEIAEDGNRTASDLLRRIEDVTASIAAAVSITPDLNQDKWNTFFAKRFAGSTPITGLRRIEYWRLPAPDEDGIAKGTRFVHDATASTVVQNMLPNIPAAALGRTIQTARQSGRATISSPVTLDAKEGARHVLLVRYVPQPPQPPSRGLVVTEEYVVSLIEIEQIVAALVQRQSQRIFFTLSQNNQPPFGTQQIETVEPVYSHDMSFELGQRTWTLRATSTPALESDLASSAPKIILLVGFIATAFLFGLVWLLTRLREQANNLAQSMTEKLRDQAKFTEDLIELNPNPIFRKDAEGRFVAVNRAWEQLSGRDRRDVLGKTNREFQRPDIAAESERHDEQLFDSEAGYEAREVFITNTSGREFQTIVAKQVLKRGDGEIDGLIGTITDVTPIKKLEQRLAHQQEQLDLVINSSQQGIWDANLTAGGSGYFSERYAEILGYANGKMPDDFVWDKWIHPEDRENFARELARCFKRESVFFDDECRVKHTSGNYIWIRARGIAQFNNQARAVRFIGSIVDITDRKTAEARLIEANIRVTDAARAKEAFLATMSHEIRTPLNGVLGMASLLAETQLNDEQRDYIRLVRASGDTLLRLIDDVLDFSKIESGRMTLEALPIEITAIVEEAIELVAEKVREKDIALIYDIADDVPYYIIGDSTRLRQILLNLLSNAIKFTTRGEIRCALTAKQLPDARIEIEGRVTDTGIGIPADRVNMLFQPFTQVDASTTRKFGGTGLGLAIVKRLTESMGGTTHVESVEGEGATFIFTIRTQAARGPLRPYMQRGLPEFLHQRIFVADPNPHRLTAVTRLLTAWGLSVTPSPSDQASQRYRHDGPFDIVMADFLMGRAEGQNLADAIHIGNALRREEGEPATVVILASALQRADALARGMTPVIRHDMFVVRPIGRSRLFDMLMRAATHATIRDVATRPFTPEPMHDDQHKQLMALRTSPGTSPGMSHDMANVGHGDTIPAQNDAQQRLPIDEDTTATNGLRILVAEDNEVNQVVIKGMLAKLKHHVTVVENGQLAVEAVTSTTFDLVLMDIQMPVLDGIAAMQEIRRRAAPRGDRMLPPIVAMTANALAGDREHYLAEGMDDYLAKPIRPKELSALIERLLPNATHANPAAQQKTRPTLPQTLTLPPTASPIPAPAPPKDISAVSVMPILDLEQLEDMRGLPAGDGEESDAAANGLIALFRTKSQERVQLMQQALERADWMVLGDTAHSMRGAASSIGFPRVADACKRLELATRRLMPKAGLPTQTTDASLPTPAEIDELFDDIQAKFFEANQALEKWLG
jgi:PAS domain S-box-containing protein